MADLTLKQSLEAMDIAEYLRQHPRFLENFPDVAADSTTLLLRWGTTAVPLHIEVTPSNSVAPTG